MLTLRASVRAVGKSAVLIITLVVFCLIATSDVEPWGLKLGLAGFPGLLILAGIPWLFSAGEQGAQVELVDGPRRLLVTGINPFGQAIARAAMDAYSRAPIPKPSGAIGPGTPANPASIIEGAADLPADAPIADKPLKPPADAGHLI